MQLTRCMLLLLKDDYFLCEIIIEINKKSRRLPINTIVKKYFGIFKSNFILKCGLNYITANIYRHPKGILKTKTLLLLYTGFTYCI